jgi:hypothetical protein
MEMNSEHHAPNALLQGKEPPKSPESRFQDVVEESVSPLQKIEAIYFAEGARVREGIVYALDSYGRNYHFFSILMVSMNRQL